MEVSPEMMAIVRREDSKWKEFKEKVGKGFEEDDTDLKAVIAHFSGLRTTAQDAVQDAIQQAGITDGLSLIESPEPPQRKAHNKSGAGNDGRSHGKPTATDQQNSETSKNSNHPAITPLLKSKVSGHGKHSYRDFLEGAEIIKVPPDFPSAHGATTSVYGPAFRVVLTGSMNLKARVYVLPRRRLNTGELQTTPLPRSVGPLYGYLNAEAVASLVLSHYKLGATHYGISTLHNACGVPLSPSTQWDAIEKGANVVFRVHKELVRALADAEVIQIDSTTKKVMSIKKDIEQRQVDAKACGKDPNSVRHGIRTTAVLGTTQSQEKISLFVTGEEHAGEVLDQLLEQRQAPEEVILACDASTQNTDTKFKDNLLLCLCNAHAFRKFVECEKDYPNLTPQIVAAYRKVFEHERFCVARGMQGQERLNYHRKYSSPLMAEIYHKLEHWQDSMLFTPKSAMGKAASYFINNFEGLCGFLMHENGPLHNNADEIEIKVSVKHRKNSLFYQTETGASVGDIWMSLIQTAILNKINPWNWLVEVLRNPENVARSPKAWLPLNWRTVEGAM